MSANSVPLQRIPIVLSQARLEEVLRNHVEQAGVKIEWGVEFAGLEQNDEKVTVHLKTDGKEVEETFDYVLAADGGHGRNSPLFLGKDLFVLTRLYLIQVQLVGPLVSPS